MIKVKRIDHVAIAVGDRDGAGQKLGDLFGLCAGVRETVPTQKADVAFWHPEPDNPGVSGTARTAGAAGTAGPAGKPESLIGPNLDTALEIIAPAGPDGNPGLVRFLDRHGPGLHHICLEVEDLPAALAALKAAGVRLIDESPRPGARGHLVAFLHPASTGGVLFELCAIPQGAQA